MRGWAFVVTEPLRDTSVSGETVRVRWWNRLAQAFARNRSDIAVWALTALIVAVGAGAAALVASPWPAVIATTTAGAVRLAFEVGRRERVASLRDELREQAAHAVARAAARHVLHRVLWQDQEAFEESRRRIVERDDSLPHLKVEVWYLDKVVEAGASAFDIRARKDHEWLEISNELERCHDDFAAAVGPYMADLPERVRGPVTECLESLEEARIEAARALVLLPPPDITPDWELADQSAVVFEKLAAVWAAACNLGAADYEEPD